MYNSNGGLYFILNIYCVLQSNVPCTLGHGVLSSESYLLAWEWVFKFYVKLRPRGHDKYRQCRANKSKPYNDTE